MKTSIAKHSLWLTASFAISKVCQLVAQIILARLLTPEEFGIWGIVLLVTTLSSLFKDWAIAAVLIQRGLENQKLVNAVYSLGINVSISMFILQIIVGFPVAHFFEAPIVFPLTAVAAFVFLLGAGAGAHSAILQRQMRFRALAICDASAGVARLGGAVVCASLGGGVWSFAVAEVAMATVDGLLKRWLSGYHFQYQLIPDRAAVQEVQGYITSLIGINLAVYANTNGDNLLIGKLLGVQSLGYYNLAYQLAMLPTFALSQINRISFSLLSQQDRSNQKVYLTRKLKLYALVSAPLYGLAFVVAPWLIPLVYGSQWKTVVSLFQILLVFAYARGFMSILGTTLNAVNKPQINALINWVLVPLSLPAFAIGANLGEIKGVAIAVALVMGIGATIWFWVTTCRAVELSLIELAKPVLLPTVTVILLLVLISFVSLPIPLQPLVILGVYGIVLVNGKSAYL